MDQPTDTSARERLGKAALDRLNGLFPGRARKPTDPPRLSNGVPLLGHSVEFVRSALDLLFRAERELGEVAEFRVAGRPMVALFGPEAQTAIFRAPDSELDPSDAYAIMTPVFGEGMVYDAPPEKMQQQFRMLIPALKDARMRTYGEVVVGEVEKSIASWGDSGEIDVVTYFRTLTNYTSSHCLIGREFRERLTSDFAGVYHDLERGVTPLAYIDPHLPIPSFKKRDRARARMVEMIGTIMRERRRSGARGEDFLQTLMESQYADGTPLTEHEVTGMLLSAMFAGHHTSSVTSSWTLIELLKHPDYLARVLAELERVYGADRPVDYASLREIPLTEYAVKEALRLHPPLFMLVRVAKKDFRYKSYVFPKGTWLVVSPTVAHRMKSVFADPDRFDPERFAPGREEDKRDFAYIPFGGGHHRCLGSAFALLQIKAILALLLRRYEFSLGNDVVKPDFHGLVIGPSEPCRVRYRRRKHAGVDSPVSAHTNGAPATAPTNGAPLGSIEKPRQPRLRLAVDTDFCQGHAVCVSEAPNVFTIGDDGKVKLLTEFPDEASHPAVELAEKHCPTGSIRLARED
jgi:sterol 14-demethylase